MDGIGAEVSQKIRSAIKAKLMELGAYVDEELPDYIMVMVANKRSRDQMEDDLQLFLGSNTAEFTNWLHQVLQKLQEVTVASLERKRKSSANDNEGDNLKKDKHKKSLDKKKIKRSNEQTKSKESEVVKEQSGKHSEENAEKPGENIIAVSSETVKTINTQESQKGTRRVSVSSKVADDDKQDDKTAAGRPKIVLMQSDDDDDEDFINIKADAEAEELLDAELPKEVQENHQAQPSPTETKKNVRSVQVSDRLGTKVGSGSILSRLGMRKAVSLTQEPNKHTSPLLRVTDRLGDKVTDRIGARKIVALRSDSTTEDKVTSRLGDKVNLTSDRRNISVAHISPTSVERPSRPLIAKTGIEAKPLRRPIEEEDASSKEQIPRKRPLLSRVVAMNKDAGEGEEEEYDPANPAVGSVASVVRVKPRPKVPAALQANKNLILKAMAEAQKSVANAPKRIEPEERVDGLFTKKFRDSKGRDKIAITLPNRRMQPRDKSPVSEKPSDIERIVIPVKLEAARSISSVNLQQKIVIQVSSEKVNETEEPEVSKLDELPEEAVEDVDKLTEIVSEVETEELKDEGFEEIQRLISCDSQDLDLEEVEQCAESSSDIPVSVSEIPRSESPQFVVTLDGLDPTIFQSRKKPNNTTIIVSSPNPEPELEKEREEVETEKTKEKRPASPILFMKSTISEAPGSASDASKQKINERCKYWPACRSGDKCDYLHPTVPCKSFPSCKFGDKCLYIHPNCKFDASCTRRDCPFTHASPRNMASVVTAVPPARPAQNVCKFYPKCSNVNCRFVHPKMCRYGRFCNRKTECSFRHEEIPPADKLKWICPFRL